MSNQSGITAAPALVDTFNKQTAPALVITLSSDATQLVQDETYTPPASADTAAVLRSLHSHLSTTFPEPRFAVVGQQERVFVLFIPDVAPIRQKLLYASSKNTLLVQLGAKFAKHHTVALTELAELEPAAFARATLAAVDEALLTDKEKDLGHLDALQNLALTNRQLPAMHKGDGALFFGIAPLLAAVLASDLAQQLVVMSIDADLETLVLTAHEKNVPVSGLVRAAEQAVAAEPAPMYAVYGYGQGKVALIYLCPSGCKVKARMMYAANKRGLILHLQADYFPLDPVLEVGDLDELDTSKLVEGDEKPEVPTQGLKFSKPRGPRRR